MDDTLEMDKVLPFYHNILNNLSECAGESFFLWDMLSNNLYLPPALGQDYVVFRPGKEYCTLSDWFRITYFKDLPALQAELEQLKSGVQTTQDTNYRILNRDGNIVWINCRGKVLLSGNGPPRWMVGRFSDTLAQGKADRLTGAFNMDMLKEELEHLLATGCDGYLLLVDVDDQKSINLKNGLAFGDQLLIQVAEALESASDGCSRIYRTNGDCFAINLPGQEAQDVTRIFAKTQQWLEGQCTLSGGCVPYQTYKVPDAGTLYQYAENSVDCAKAHGKNILWFFSADDYEKDLAALELKEDLHKSILAGFTGFSLQYQPQVLSHSYKLFGVEALLRYCSPRRGPVSSTEVIPILEESKLICAVGTWVLDTALAQCRLWRETIPDLCVSVNMSYTQLCQTDIADLVLKSLRQSGLPGSALTIEVTESLQLLDYPHLNDIFRLWKQFGIAISIDDFGTGYSSLGRLKEMEIDEIKIDRCFVRNIQHSAYNYRLLSNMIELADSSQIRVCCEGIEAAEELVVLEDLHPTLLQGFLFSKPCSPEEFQALYLLPSSPQFQARLNREDSFRRLVQDNQVLQSKDWPEEEVVQALLDAENDIFYVSDLDTYELYYLNPAGQRLFGARDYRGKKCYRVLQGLDSPCSFCTNKHLKSEIFYVWDQFNPYCGRHFILKDKLLSYKGRLARMEVALDITQNETISQAVQERLHFARKVVDYAKIISENTNYDAAVQNTLMAVGEFYQADRAYLFEADPKQEGYWNNTFEWCRPNVTPQLNNLQHVPSEAFQRWLDLFMQNKSVVILNLDPLQKSSPAEWAMLNPQDIDRLIAVPLWLNETLIAFIGIDNPRYSIRDDSQAKVLSYFLISRMRQERSLARETSTISLSGCPRIDHPQPLPEIYIRDVFEYNESRQAIVFHTERELIDGEDIHQSDFPSCWITSGIVHPHFAQEIRSAFSQIHLKSHLTLPEILLRDKSGSYSWFKLTLQHLEQEKPDTNTVLVILEPTRPERVKELEHIRTKRFYQALLSETIAYAEVDLESGELKSSGGLWGANQPDHRSDAPSFLGKLFKQLSQYLSPNDLLLFQGDCDPAGWVTLQQGKEICHRFSYRCPIGQQLCWVELVIHIFREEITQNVYALICLKDITTEKERSLAQADAANRDPLTGLYNRAAFERMVRQHVLHSSCDPCGVLMLLDIDNFKHINDRNGHLEGDHVLTQVAQILLSAFRKDDLVGRLGGDEFLIFIHAPLDHNALASRLTKLQEDLQSQIRIPLTSSIGITLVRQQSFDYNRHLGQADIALYQSKQQGKNRFLFFEDLSP